MSLIKMDQSGRIQVAVLVCISLPVPNQGLGAALGAIVKVWYCHFFSREKQDQQRILEHTTR